MSFAATIIRGAFLNWRLAVKGIQKAERSFGTVGRSSAMANLSGLGSKMFDQMVRITLAERLGQSSAATSELRILAALAQIMREKRAARKKKGAKAS